MQVMPRSIYDSVMVASKDGVDKRPVGTARPATERSQEVIWETDVSLHHRSAKESKDVKVLHRYLLLHVTNISSQGTE